MNIETIRQRLSGEFRPFIIRMTDGREYEVSRPELIAVGKSDVAVVDQDGGIVLLDSLHITSIKTPQSKEEAGVVLGGAKRWLNRMFGGEEASLGKLLRSVRTDNAVSNLTPRAQQVLALARQEADRFNHNFVGTEHLLLGLIKLGQGCAVNVLQRLGLDLETVQLAVEEMVGTGPDQRVTGNIPYTPRVRKVFTLAAKEARNLNHTYVGTEHILLGLLQEGDGVAARVLKNLDVDAEKTRDELLKELDPKFITPLEAGKGSDVLPDVGL